MRYQLSKPINPELNTIEQILTNRGIPREEVYHYLNTTDDDINSPLDLGEKSLNAAAQSIIQHISSKDKTTNQKIYNSLPVNIDYIKVEYNTLINSDIVLNLNSIFLLCFDN